MDEYFYPQITQIRVKVWLRLRILQGVVSRSLLS